MKKVIFVILLLVICSNIFAGGSDSVYIPDDSIPADKVWFVKGFLQDEGKLWTSPAKMTAKKFTFWVPVIGATMFVLANDEKIYSEFKSFQGKNKWVDKAGSVVTYGGESITTVAIGGIFYMSGLALNNKKAGQTGILCIEALAHAGIVITTGKLISGRQRPGYAEGKDYWHWFPSSFNMFTGEPHEKYEAFPSGHTIAAWSVATVIARQYRDRWWVPVLTYTAATGVGLSRITEDAHWMSDVIIGGALGYTIGSFVVRERKNTKWMLFPVSDGKNVMLSSSYKL